MAQGGINTDGGAQPVDLQREDAVRSCHAAQAAVLDARAQQETAERNWREAIRPIVKPTPAEVRAAKERLEYKEGLVHVAVAGVSGSGKSSLVNALRGLRNRDEGAAPTSSSRVTTSTIARFPDPDPARPFVWYDVPGAGTLEVPEWQYFTDQGLYIFDCIIVLFDTRLTATDIALLRGAARFTIPTYIVRSKALQHISNLAIDISEDGDDDGTSPPVFQRAREQYVRASHASVTKNLEAANLVGERVFLVDKDTLVKVVKGVPAQDAIDEHDLVKALLDRSGRR
ncbi:hypothetical protein FOMPIDRAFT_1135394 [Fomitopsis schrenkii]|uniref:IRG-type G domain-containing protein n=1 Tax=Fomitopsis schrenkii TaxID=2126942 RepID=S8F4E8_FOMSC|nr:hypothetical protein FOMPIDRAFT_1135394 [Fomitopsis schrenkii]